MHVSLNPNNILLNTQIANDYYNNNFRNQQTYYEKELTN